MKPTLLSVLATLILAGGSHRTAAADERIPAIPESAFESLFNTVRPAPGESPWRDIEWFTNITEARRRAVAEDKPLVIFTAADGSPLGRT